MPTSSTTAKLLPKRRTAILRRTLGLLALAGLLALPQAASAQDRQGRGGDRVELRIDALRQAAALTDAQVADVRALFEAQAANRPAPGARRSSSPQDRAAMQAERAGREAEMDRQIEALLTPEQVARYRTWRESQPRGRGGRGGDSR
mgnify:CR=1 FL=1